MQISSLHYSFNTPEEVQTLLTFASSVSERCDNFTQYLVERIDEEEQLDINQLLEVIFNLFNYEVEQTSRPVCAKVFEVGSYGFICCDCTVEQGAIFCIDCFNNSNHKGHQCKKSKITTEDSTCDCGNEEVLRKEGFCCDHQAVEQANVQVDEALTESFIKDMKYLIYLLAVIRTSKNPQVKASLNKLYPYALAFYLKSFNQGSMISNEMTFMLFKSNLSDLIPALTYPAQKPVLEIIMSFYIYDEQCQLIFDLWIILFTRPEFKRYLIINYTKFISNNCHIWTTKLTQIAFQIFPSNKLIGELIDSKEIAPFRICMEKVPGSWSFKDVAEANSKYLADLEQIGCLKFGVGEKFIKYFLEEGNITHISGYEVYEKATQEEKCEQYYIEPYYFRVLFTLLGKISTQKLTLLKATKDVVKCLEEKYKQPEKAYLSVYITKQRSLLALIFTFFDGQIEQATKIQFLKSLGLSYQIVFNMLQQVLYVTRFYALNSSNLQTQERYWQYYSHSLVDMPRRIFSVDLQLIKFCTLALNSLKEHTVQIVQYNELLSVTYQQPVTLATNKMPLQNLISLPLKFMQSLLSTQIKGNQTGTYDRKKAVEILVDYVGFLQEILITNHSELFLRNWLNFNQEQPLKQFYGSLIKSLRHVKNEDFRKIYEVFLDRQQSPYLKQFFSQFCEISDNRVSLKKQKENQFTAFNLSYLKSKKRCTFLQPHLEENMKEYRLSHLPAVQESPNKSQLTEEVKTTIFNEHFIERIAKVVKNYQKILTLQADVRKSDIGIFSQLVEQIIRLNYTLENQQLHVVLEDLRKSPELFQSLPEYTQKEIVICLKEVQNKTEEENSQKNQKYKSAKEKKMLKFKEKQNKAFEKIKQGQKKQEETLPQNYQNNKLCIYCRQSDEEEPLKSLNYISRSTFFSRFYLDCTRHVYKIVACGHYFHESCFVKSYGKGQRKFIYCDWCTFNSNIQLSSMKNNLKTEDKINLLQSDCQKIFAFVKQIQKGIISLLPQYFKNPLKIQTLQISIEEIVLQSLASAILEGIIMSNDQSESLLCLFVGLKGKLTSVQNLLQSIQKQISCESKNENSKIYRSAYKFILMKLCSILLASQKAQIFIEQIKKLEEFLPKELTQQIANIFENFLLNQNIASSQKHNQSAGAKVKPSFPELATNLQKLTKLAEKCPNCEQKTNQIAICLICSFMSCIGCKTKNLTQHTIEEHGWSSIFIRIDNGCPILISCLKNVQMKPIYKNYMGEIFNHGFEEWKKNAKCDHNLDLNAFEKLKKDLIRCRVEQEINNNKENEQKGQVLQNIP